MDEYERFLISKRRRTKSHGKIVTLEQINPILFDFQRAVTQWAVAKGRCAMFLDTGLGKTFCQLEWARLLDEKTLIIAPLSVARQTVKEGMKLGIDVRYCRDDKEVGDSQIVITNYEMMDHFSSNQFSSVILDESSILKSISSKTRQKLINKW